MSEEMRRLLVEAAQTEQRVLIDPSEDELRAAAERLRAEGKLYCTRCRKLIQDDGFVTRRISFGPRLQAVVNLHPECDEQARASGAGDPAPAEGGGTEDGESAT